MSSVGIKIKLQWRTENDMCICLIDGIYLINGTANMAHITVEFSTQLVMLRFLNLLFVSRRIVWINSNWFHPVPTVLEFIATLGPFWGAGGQLHWLECLSYTMPNSTSFALLMEVSFTRYLYNIWSRLFFRGSSRAPRVWTHGPKHLFPSIRVHLASVHSIKS